jgi:multidrug efflux system membrane fusion protein
VDERAFLKYRKLALVAGSVEKPTLVCEAALDGEEGFPHKGVIDFFDNKLDASMGTIRMRGIFKNQDRSLIHGNFVRVRMPIERLDSAILIPEAAILTEQTRKYVYVLNSQDMTVQQRVVSLGPLQGMNRVILSGLSKDDTLL